MGIEASSERTADICLVVPPFDSVMFPALGASVLAAALKARGLSVSVVYGSLLLAARMGAEVYRSHCNLPIRLMLGERLFLPYAYPPELLATLGSPVGAPQDGQQLFDDAGGLVGSFIETVARQVLAKRPKLVGFSTNFQQTMASVAIARRIRQKAPDTRIVFGGANISSPMGEALADVFPWIDYFFSGEADIAFPDFCERLLRDGAAGQPKVTRCAPISDMRVVEPPDFSDYFAALRHFQKRGKLPAELPDFITLETSRGCWWGEKHHCTFCGLNVDGMAFRTKPADRALREITELTARWGVGRVHFSDNILPRQYFNDLLPALAELPKRPRLFFEVKANLRDEELAIMARAGIDMIQPGIEAFSSHVLRLMQKGVSGMQNVRLLRSAKSHGIQVVWNYLYGFPGERIEDYEAALVLIPKIEHLNPPSDLNRLIVDRYSPYHFDHAKYGIAEVKPFASYASLYPRGTPLADIAYHFNGLYSTPLLDDPDLLTRMRKAVARWRKRWFNDKPRLTVVPAGKRIAVADTRKISAAAIIPLSREAEAALVYFAKPRPIGGTHDGHDDRIDELLARNFLIEHENTLLNVVTGLEPFQRQGVLGDGATADMPAARRADMPAPTFA